MFASNTSQVSSDAIYVEDVFSTYLYTGNGSSQTITNGIDLAGKGGLFWVKARAVAGSHGLMYGSGTELSSNSANGLPASQPYTFGASGITFTGGVWSGFSSPNESGRVYTSWTFRKQPKFFDIVTYTGTGVARTIAHNLGSVPGCIIIKRLDDISNWPVYHRSNLANDSLFLSNTDSINISKTYWNNTRPTSTVFSLGDDSIVNQNGGTFVAYLFAHDAGGFGTAGTDNVISCGSFTTDGSGYATVTLGYEPQWVLVKKTSDTGAWAINDTMRGWVTGSALNTSDDATLFPNVSNAETTQGRGNPTATGFGYWDSASSNYIYIAIRRGPMKTPTSGSSVLTVYTAASTAANQVIGTIPVDLSIVKQRTEANPDFVWDRLRGSSKYLITTSAGGESTADYAGFDQSNGYREKSGFSAYPIYWLMARAPSFMDVVCYTGTGSARTVAHNLGVAPELMIVKRRTNPNGDGGWAVYPNNPNGLLQLNNGAAQATISGSSSEWNGTAPTASVFSLGSYGTVIDVNASGQIFVAYLFASCPGVSKVGSYSGTGATQTISCGFAARWVMIKRTDSTGDWWVWDTARGMVAGTDPRLAFNLTSAETNANWVYTDASGFQIVTTDASVNASGGSYIFLAVG